jgi:hypothetical protein
MSWNHHQNTCRIHLLTSSIPYVNITRVNIGTLRSRYPLLSLSLSLSLSASTAHCARQKPWTTIDIMSLGLVSGTRRRWNHTFVQKPGTMSPLQGTIPANTISDVGGRLGVILDSFFCLCLPLWRFMWPPSEYYDGKLFLHSLCTSASFLLVASLNCTEQESRKWWTDMDARRK